MFSQSKRRGKITVIFLFSRNFSVPQKGETWGTKKKCENKNKCHLHTCELLKIEILNIAIRKKIIFKLSFLILNTVFVNVNKHLAIPFVKLAKGWSRVCHLCFFCLYRITGLSIPTLEVFLATCILIFVSMVDQSQIYSSSILPLGLF